MKFHLRHGAQGNDGMRRGQRLFALLILVLCLPGAGSARAESLTWNIRSDHPNAVSLEFYSEDGNTSWPGAGDVYVLDDNEDHAFPLQCRLGERICYGAWVRGDETQFWGVGVNGSQFCESCCYQCDGGETPLIVITE